MVAGAQVVNASLALALCLVSRWNMKQDVLTVGAVNYE
jgi:hypothetical protein